MASLANSLTEKEGLLKPWQTFSSQLAWPGFRIETYSLPPANLTPYVLTSHTAIFNIANPVVYSIKSENHWRKSRCISGSIVQLQSPGEVSETQWDSHFEALSLSIDSHFIEQLTEIKNFAFSPQTNINDALIADSLSKLRGEIATANPQEKIYVESLILCCIVHLACTYPVDGKKIFAPKGKLSAAQLKQVIEYTRTCIHKNVSLTQLAACANLSAFHFARLFRQTVGISPYQYVLQMKIEYAKKLIKQHNGSISDVAYILNFTDQAHFSNAFKKITGICPRQFQQTTAVF